MNKIVKSFSWAMSGIRTAWREEVNFRIEMFIALAVLVLGIWLKLSTIDWIVIIGCIGAVLAAEMLNTAMEDLCDKVQPNIDPTIGKIKDIMSGFVLVVSSFSVVVGIIIISHYF